MDSISIFLNSDGLTSSLEEDGSIRVYTYDSGKNAWKITKEFEFSLIRCSSISESRRIILNMIQSIGDCRIFAAREVAGQLYSVLEANSFSIYEVEGKPEQFLDSILALEREEKSKNVLAKSSQALSFRPERTGTEGTYFINLKVALNTDPGLTSKKILLPFLTEGNFKVLEVVCDHVPRWFDDEFEKRGLLSTVSRLGENEYKVTVAFK